MKIIEPDKMVYISLTDAVAKMKIGDMGTYGAPCNLTLSEGVMYDSTTHKALARVVNGHMLITFSQQVKKDEFNAIKVANDLGLTVEMIMEFRRSAGHNDEPPDTIKLAYSEMYPLDNIISYASMAKLGVFRVADVMNDPCDQDVLNYNVAVEFNYKRCKTLRCSYSLKHAMGTFIEDDGSEKSYTNHGFVALAKQQKEFVKVFNLDASLMNDFTAEIAEMNSRLKMIQSTGIGEMKKIRKDMLLPDAVPVEEVIAMMKLPQFEFKEHYTGGKYEKSYTHDITTQLLASQYLRDKFGTRGVKTKE